jgi:ancient ubiquitous protein 1
LSAESRSTEDVVPFVIQPEPLPTNGSHSLFQFSDWPCRLATNVQPIALTARRPFGIKIVSLPGKKPEPLSIQYIHSLTQTTVYRSQWWDLFWTLFVPTTVFRVKLLAPMERREGEEGGQLSQRVQESLREELKLQESQVTLDNVTAWLKASRKRPTPGVSPTPRPRAVTTTTTTSQTPATPPPSSSREPTGLDRMVDQVSAVLPQVPHTTIRKDLLRTQSVDATITNFLEGVVTYDPIPSPPAKSAPKPLPPPSYATSTPPTFKSSALRPRKYYSPAMEAMHRQLSLEEKKIELVQKARRRYIEKHGLNVNG